MLLAGDILTAAAALSLVAIPALPAAATGAPAPGLASTVLTLDNPNEIKGYDVAVDRNGTAYVGWIATAPPPTLRVVKLCVLPLGATACSATDSTDALGPSSASGLRVNIDAVGNAELLWYHDTSASGPHAGAIASITTTDGGATITTPTDIQSAPSNGQLFDARLAPSGAIWTVAAAGSVPTEVEVGPAPGTVSIVTSPVGLANVQLAFARAGNSTADVAVMTGTKYGSVSDPVLASGQPAVGAAFPGFANVPGTEHANAGLVSVLGQPVLETKGVGVSPYPQVSSHWTGTRFSPPRRTGYTYSCPELNMALSADVSGRVSYIAYHCSDVTIGNLPGAGSIARMVRFPAGGTVTYTPAIASLSSGRAMAVWSVQGGGGNILHAAWVLLPAVPFAIRNNGGHGHSGLSLPFQCLPPVGAKVIGSGGAAAGWKLSHVYLTRDGSRVPSSYTLDGSTLPAGKVVHFTTTAVVTRGRQVERIHSAFAVHACPSP